MISIEQFENSETRIGYGRKFPSLFVVVNDFARIVVQNYAGIAMMVKSEHSKKRAGDRVERLVSDAPEIPVILNETENGRGAVHGVIDVIPFRKCEITRKGSRSP